MFAMTVHQENKLFDLRHRSAAANLSEPIFHFYRCKYSNYYNWCMQQGFFEGKTDFFHYIIAAEDTWIDIFSQEPPRVFCQYFGKHLGDKELNRGYIFDAFYEYT